MSTKADQKAVVRALVRDLLAEDAPGELADLPIVFESVYRVAEQRAEGAERRDGERDGLPFDASFLAGTVLSSAVWMIYNLVCAHRLSVTAAQHTALLRQLARGAESEARIRELDERIGKFLGALDALSQELEERERTARREQRHLQAAFPKALAKPGEEPLPFPRGESEAMATSVPASSAAELTLLVAYRGPIEGSFLLRYRLLGQEADGNPVHLHSAPLLLSREPTSYISKILADTLAHQPGTRLGQLGIFLGRHLLPANLGDRLRELAQGTVNLQVLSEEPTIPWELVCLPAPEDGAAAPAPTPFLAEAFALSQWPGKEAPTLRFSTEKIAVVAPDDCGLPGVAAEVAFLEGLSEAGPEIVRIPARHDAVLGALADGNLDIFHFTGHGVAEGDEPDLWALILEDGERLTPVDLAAVHGGLSSRSPLVVLNACRSARGGWSLTGAGGIGPAFLETGAGAVLGTHWPVSDSCAQVFAEAFYHHFLAGVPIAEATRRARRVVYRSSPTDPSWLAYTLLAHPGARCTLPDGN